MLVCIFKPIHWLSFVIVSPFFFFSWTITVSKSLHSLSKLGREGATIKVLFFFFFFPPRCDGFLFPLFSIIAQSSAQARCSCLRIVVRDFFCACILFYGKKKKKGLASDGGKRDLRSGRLFLSTLINFSWMISCFFLGWDGGNYDMAR